MILKVPILRMLFILLFNLMLGPEKTAECIQKEIQFTPKSLKNPACSIIGTKSAGVTKSRKEI
jgi:hypothetical protein